MRHFFLLVENANQSQKEVHEIGSHSYDHQDLAQLSTDEIQMEISKTNEALEKSLGKNVRNKCIGCIKWNENCFGRDEKRDTSTIITISSIAKYKAFKDYAVYVVSKFGVHGLTEIIRQEVVPYNF
ncbi:SDR family NAD(P)-dependent oxidoreductase [Enterococcus faecalis]|uniref:SDR family NAD(P)-dependent oxidoreductase n=1 Tax=Enterococcus faecalis TaxID=1351 RepID=UPI002DBEC10A|nr:SDR family NAD(P)-dependent oxidoreductase [Enterococcus faecalis]MEB7776295.1 SDR family NAD(P)-dependent oxidoreductase [Enterococcus faecalis]